MIQNGPVSVLVAPLDWGLGHATRCIPVIRELIHQGAEVTIAAGSGNKALLKSEFPMLEVLEIPGDPIHYKRGFWLKWGVLLRIPVLLKQIQKEKEWLNELLKHRHIDVVISDNRYGLFHEKCFCVFITHQLQILSGWGDGSSVRRWALVVGRWIDRQILKWNYKFISKFSECWVPDFDGNLSVGGLLSHPSLSAPFSVKYLGILSRFHSSEILPEKNSILVLISGPEPQRTEFEKVIIGQPGLIDYQVVVVRGLPDAVASSAFKKAGAEFFNHLPSKELNELIIRSEYIIARSGYSTIMDLFVLRKQAILVPTPGQTEQEYLGDYMNKSKWMYSVSQKNFNLQNAIAGFRESPWNRPDMPKSNLQPVIHELIKSIRKISADIAER